jgi:hypothetical protein
LAYDPIVQQNFIGITQIGSGAGNRTQMAFGPDGRLYVSTFTNGIKRYDVSPSGATEPSAAVVIVTVAASLITWRRRSSRSRQSAVAHRSVTALLQY